MWAYQLLPLQGPHMSLLCAYRGHQSSRGPLRLSNRPVQPSLRRWTDHLRIPCQKDTSLCCALRATPLQIPFKGSPCRFIPNARFFFFLGFILRIPTHLTPVPDFLEQAGQRPGCLQEFLCTGCTVSTLEPFNFFWGSSLPNWSGEHCFDEMGPAKVNIYFDITPTAN